MIAGRKVWLASSAALLGLCFPMQMQGQGVALANASPRGLAPGTQTTVRFTGKHLDDANLWLSFSGEAEPVAAGQQPPADSGQKDWLITVADSEAPRVVVVRAYSARGFSDPLLLLIDPLPSSATKPGHEPAQAQTIVVPSALDRETVGFKRDYYRFHAEAGQQLAFEVFAQRLGSAMDPVLTLRNAKGGELMFSDDDPALGGDARFEYTFIKSGDYLLEVHDLEFRQGLFYRLRVGSFRFSTVAFPTGARSGKEAFFTLTGPSGVVQPSLPVTAEPRREGTVQVGTRHLGARVCFSDLTQGVECEPNDSANLAMKIPVPMAISGRLDEVGDTDLYRFTVRSNTTAQIRPLAGSLGSAAALNLELRDAQGGIVKSSGDGPASEVPVRFHADADTSYTLSVRDRFGRGGSDYVYHLLIDTSPPPFAITLGSTDRFIAAPHSVAKVHVKCERFGYEGPIDLSVSGLAEPFTLTGNRLAEKQNSTDLRIHFPAGWRQDGWKIMRIIGQAKWEGRPTRISISTQPLLRQRFASLPTPLTGVPDAIFVSPTQSPICVAATTAALTVVPGETTVLPVAVTRKPSEEKPEPIRINLRGLPPGVQQKKELKIAPDNEVGEIQIAAKDDVALSTVTNLQIEATTRYLGQDLIIQSSPVTLTILAKPESQPDTQEAEPTTAATKNDD